MKAKIKETGEIIEVMQVYEKGESFYVRLDMLDTLEVRYHINELEFEGIDAEGKFAKICLNGIKQDIDNNPDYWTRLEHQYAGMFMQAMITDPALINVYSGDGKIAMKSFVESATDICYDLAHALVEKMKNKEK